MNEWDVKVGKEENVGAQHAECPCALGQKVPYDRDPVIRTRLFSVRGCYSKKKEKDARTTDVAFRVIRHNLSEISRLSLPCTKALMDQSWVQLVDQSWVQLGAHVQ